MAHRYRWLCLTLFVLVAVSPATKAHAARRSCEQWTAKQWVGIVKSCPTLDIEGKTDDEKIALYDGVVAHAQSERPECESTFQGFQVWFQHLASADENATYVEPPFPLTPIVHGMSVGEVLGVW